MKSVITVLELPHVAPENRQSVRALMEDIINSLTITLEPGNCYRVAREVARIGGPRVEYVEGQWKRMEDDRLMDHAWNLVDGQIVDLFEELSFVENGPEDWQHEARIVAPAEKEAQGESKT